MRDQASHPYKMQAKLQFCSSSSFYFSIANKTKDSVKVIASIPWLQSALNFFMNGILNFDFSGLFPNIWTVPSIERNYYLSMSWFCPVCWSWNMTIFLVFSAFTPRSISLLAVTKAAVFLCNSMYASAHYINIISINQKAMHTI
jgi:hypothetical protein